MTKRNTIKINNNGVAWASNVERFQFKKYITTDNPLGDIIKIKFANMEFIVPTNIWFKTNMAKQSFFDLHQTGQLGQWKQEPKQSKWDKMMERKEG